MEFYKCTRHCTILVVLLWYLPSTKGQSTSSLPDCVAPTPPTNGTVTYPALTSGSLATYTCDFGHILTGVSVATCNAGFWSDPAPVCSPVDCGPPAQNPNSVISCPSTTYLQRCSVVCDTGYYMVGASSLLCLSGGTWDYPSPDCNIIDCGFLTAPMDGFVAYSPGTTYGDTAVFSCSPGFSLLGTASRYCQASGVWSDNTPFCLPDVCPPPAPPTAGTVTCPGHLTDNQCTYSCNTGYTLVGPIVVTCLSVGTWDQPPPTCTVTNSSTCLPSSPSTYRLQRLYDTQYNYTVISTATAPSSVACARTCSQWAGLRCGQPDACSLALYNPTNGLCVTFYRDTVATPPCSCAAPFRCYGMIY